MTKLESLIFITPAALIGSYGFRKAADALVLYLHPEWKQPDDKYESAELDRNQISNPKTLKNLEL